MFSHPPGFALLPYLNLHHLRRVECSSSVQQHGTSALVQHKGVFDDGTRRTHERMHRVIARAHTRKQQREQNRISVRVERQRV